MDLSVDTSNCGTCGRDCNAGETCMDGDCWCGTETGCPAGSACCSGSCVNTMTNPEHCGGCGLACNPNETCSGATCNCGDDVGCGAGGQCCPSGGMFMPMGCAQIACPAFCWCGGCNPDTNWCTMICAFGVCGF